MQRSVVKSACRTLEVLQLFSEQRRPLRLHEIHEQLNYPQSSATNLVKSMVSMGYLNYNRATRTYVPTGKVASLGSWLSTFLYGQSHYVDLVEALQKRTDETAALSTQNDLFIQYFIIKTPSHAFKMPPPEGSMRLLTKSTSGMALLSRMSDRQVDKICRHINYYELDTEKRVDIPAILKELAWIRKVGYCHVEHQPTPNVSSLAVPLGETLHGIPLALGVGGIHERIASKQSQIIAAIRETIAEFRERLSYGDNHHPLLSTTGSEPAFATHER